MYRKGWVPHVRNLIWARFWLFSPQNSVFKVRILTFFSDFNSKHDRTAGDAVSFMQGRFLRHWTQHLISLSSSLSSVRFITDKLHYLKPPMRVFDQCGAQTEITIKILASEQLKKRTILTFENGKKERKGPKSLVQLNHCQNSWQKHCQNKQLQVNPWLQSERCVSAVSLW